MQHQGFTKRVTPSENVTKLKTDMNTQLKKFILPLAILANGAGWIAPQAAHAIDFFSPRISALGGAGRAGPVNNDAIYLNPSFESFVGNYSIAATYLPYGVDTGTPTYVGRSFNFSILDGRNDMFQAGVGLTMRDGGNFVHVSTSKAIFRAMGVGLSAKFFMSQNAALKNFTDFSLSMTGILSSWLQAALVVDNVAQTTEGKAFGLQREFALGFKTNISSILMLYFDPHYTPDLADTSLNGTRAGFSAGAELSVFTDIYLRGGYFVNTLIPHQNIRATGFGLGAGWLAPRISFDYGFMRGLASAPNTGANFYAHHVGTTIFF